LGGKNVEARQLVGRVALFESGGNLRVGRITVGDQAVLTTGDSNIAAGARDEKDNGLSARHGFLGRRRLEQRHVLLKRIDDHLAILRNGCFDSHFAYP